MKTHRLEAFSDGVIAILITIMVLELPAPRGVELAALQPVIPVLLAYLLSFVMLGIYWNSHHHLFHAAEELNGIVLWANLHLLFWLSLIPFATAWMGKNHLAAVPTATYGTVLFMCGLAFWILQNRITAHQGPGSTLEKAIGHDRKGPFSVLLYAVAVPLAFVHPAIAGAIYVLVALIWLKPDRRIETKVLEAQESEAQDDADS
ncbi:MAG TPA: TMEM175 family protein [Thermoanaerobaculia bacterium]|nr:TMEM175 family protein [Thermoanaerobaculia bacterium]